jgi:hypothetical protein
MLTPFPLDYVVHVLASRKPRPAHAPAPADVPRGQPRAR